jgi:hypothetical protein
MDEQMSYVYNLTLGEALPIVNRYKLVSKEEAECFMAVQLKFWNTNGREFKDAHDLLEYNIQELLKMEIAKTELPEGSPAQPVVLELIESLEVQIEKIKRCIHLLKA